MDVCGCSTMRLVADGGRWLFSIAVIINVMTVCWELCVASLGIFS